MFDSRDIIETISMIREECLDIRTITMGISLYDCQSENPDRLCTRVYDRIMTKAANLVKTGEDIEKKYGIPIINKRVSVTPASLISGGFTPDDAVKLAKTFDQPPGDAPKSTPFLRFDKSIPKQSIASKSLYSAREIKFLLLEK